MQRNSSGCRNRISLGSQSRVDEVLGEKIMEAHQECQSECRKAWKSFPVRRETRTHDVVPFPLQRTSCVHFDVSSTGMLRLLDALVSGLGSR